MRKTKKALSLVVALSMALQVLCIVPGAKETEVYADVDLGAPVAIYNTYNGNVEALTDKDESSAMVFDRRKTSDTWISVVVYDAGEDEVFTFNDLKAVGTGVHIFGCDDETVMDIEGNLESGVNYSENVQDFADIFGLTSYAHLGGKYYGENSQRLEETVSCRFLVVAVYEGWTNANIGEIYVSNVALDDVPAQVSVTFGENIGVSADGEEINSGDIVAEGSELVITPILDEGEALQSILVNGEPIEGNSFIVGEDDIEITFSLADKRTITFDESIIVTVDGEEINSGDKVIDGTELKIVPILPEDSVLDAITVNNAPIEADVYTVSGSDAEISFTYVMKRKITFGENVSVSADGAALADGDAVIEGTIITIEPILGEGEILDQILVNDAPIEGNQFTVSESDAEISFTTVLADPDSVSLGKAVYVYNIPAGNVADITDSKSSSTLVITRRDNGGVGPTWISAIVYDAGEGKTFDFNKITVESTYNVQFYGTNEAVNGEFNLLDIESTIDETHDYSKDSLFEQQYGLTPLANMANTSKSFTDMQSYRYFVVAVTEGWPNAYITEVKLTDKITAAAMGEIVYAGGEYAQKSGRWSSSAFNAQYTSDYADFAAAAGSEEALTLWGWVGGNDTQATDGAGTVSFKLQSDTLAYADVKIAGNTKRDERDFAVWITGENGETSHGKVSTVDGGLSIGNLSVYVIKNVQVFPGMNTVVIGSEDFAYSPDYIMSVVVDKTQSLLKVGEIRYAQGNEFNFGTLCATNNAVKEFFPDKAVGDELGNLPISDTVEAETAADSAMEVNMLVLADSGSVSVKLGADSYSGEKISKDCSSSGGLYTYLVKNISISEGISTVTAYGEDIAAVKLIPAGENKITFTDDITVVADGKIINSGDTVADGTTLGISAFPREGKILDEILVNNTSLAGGSYFVFGEDVDIKAEYTDIMYVTVTFDDDVAVMLNGELISSGDKVRGDAALRFGSRAQAGINAVYSVNGEEISGNTYTLAKKDIHVSVTLTPYDLTYAENYSISLYKETETELIYLLPRTGDYGSEILWEVVSGEGAVEEYDENNFALKVAITDDAKKQTTTLSASVTINSVKYSTQKSVETESRAIRSIGGRRFYVRPVGTESVDFIMQNGRLALSGAGSDLWQAPDSFGYLYTKLNDEDFTVSVRVDKIEGTNLWRRTGLMFRESDDVGARMVMLDFGHKNGAGLEFAYRSDNNGRATEVVRSFEGELSGYIKLEKKGDEFNAYYSEDAISYTKLNSEPVKIEFEQDYTVGLFTESESGYTYFSRFELNGADIFAADSVENVSCASANGKIKLNWTEPEEYSTKSFATVEISADNGIDAPITEEVEKGKCEAVLEGLKNDVPYSVSLRTKSALLCTEEENTPYNAYGEARVITATAFDAAEYAQNPPKAEISLKSSVMAGEKNKVSLSFEKELPVCAFDIYIPLADGVSVSEAGMELVQGATASLADGKLKISYKGEGSVKEIGSFYIVAEHLGSYDLNVYIAASFESFEDGILTTKEALAASEKVEVIDVSYVKLTFDTGISVSINGESVASGATVRGDSELGLSCTPVENAQLVYIVNGERTTETQMSVNNRDTHISYEIIPYDVSFVEDYDISQRTETEAGVIFDLPARGEFGSKITWTLKDNSKGDTIVNSDYETDILTVNMSLNNYVDRAVELVATVRFNNVDYTVEKTAYAHTAILYELGGENFFLRQIGDDDQSKASFEIQNDQLVLGGYGTDLWTTPDSFGYFYTKSSAADYTVSVKIDRQEGGNKWRRSGIMLRQSDSDSEKMVMLDVGASNGAALEYAYRIGTSGDASSAIRSYSYPNAVWLKLEKRGNKFYAYCSEDGEKYTLLSESAVSVTMKGEYCVGIFSETDSGKTYFSRLELNGTDVFVTDNITEAAAVPSEGKIRVTWHDPYEYASKSFEDIVVSATDGAGKTTQIIVEKGVQEATFENLANGQMYTVAIRARSAPLCGESAENGATQYRALSRATELTALVADTAYLAASKPVVSMSAAKANVAVGQSEKITLAFEEMQPLYKLNLKIQLPSDLVVKEKDIKLSEELKAAGVAAKINDGCLEVTYGANSLGGIIYVTDIMEFSLSGLKAGDYTLKAEGSVCYYSLEQGELEAQINEKSCVDFKVKAANSSGGGGSTKKDNDSVGVIYAPVQNGNKVEKAPEPTEIFADKADIPTWAQKSIGRLVERKIISGIENNGNLMFMPNQNVTREQFVKLCVEAFIGVDPYATCTFTDVNETDWYYPYIATMVQKGVINGYEDGSFGVGRNISRQDMAVILYKLYLNGYIRLISGSVTSFADKDEIAPYALEEVCVLRAAGVINGFENNTFAPRESVSRSQAAKVIYGCLN